jgi:hypothetical protein
MLILDGPQLLKDPSGREPTFTREATDRYLKAG